MTACLLAIATLLSGLVTPEGAIGPVQPLAVERLAHSADVVAVLAPDPPAAPVAQQVPTPSLDARARAPSADIAMPACFESLDAFGTWMQTYYTHTESGKIVCSVLYYVESEAFGNAGSRMPTAHFYAALLGRDPKIFHDLMEELSRGASHDARAFALNVLWVIDTDDSRAILARAADSWNDPGLRAIADRALGARRPGDVLARPLATAGTLDNLWHTFFATGEEAPVRRIISVLHLAEDGTGMEIVIGGAARWSLGALSREQPRVLEIVKKAAGEETGVTKSILEEIIKKATEPSMQSTNPKD